MVEQDKHSDETVKQQNEAVHKSKSVEEKRAKQTMVKSEDIRYPNADEIYE